eukprot:g2864.t1
MSSKKAGEGKKEGGKKEGGKKGAKKGGKKKSSASVDGGAETFISLVKAAHFHLEQKQPQDALQKLGRAADLLQQGKKGKTEAKAKDKECTLALLTGKAHFALGQLEEAQQQYERAAKLAPARIEPYQGLAETLRALPRPGQPELLAKTLWIQASAHRTAKQTSKFCEVALQSARLNLHLAQLDKAEEIAAAVEAESKDKQEQAQDADDAVAVLAEVCEARERATYKSETAMRTTRQLQLLAEKRAQEAKKHASVVNKLTDAQQNTLKAEEEDIKRRVARKQQQNLLKESALDGLLARLPNSRLATERLLERRFTALYAFDWDDAASLLQAQESLLADCRTARARFPDSAVPATLTLALGLPMPIDLNNQNSKDAPLVVSSDELLACAAQLLALSASKQQPVQVAGWLGRAAEVLARPELYEDMCDLEHEPPSPIVLSWAHSSDTWPNHPPELEVRFSPFLDRPAHAHLAPPDQYFAEEKQEKPAEYVIGTSSSTAGTDSFQLEKPGLSYAERDCAFLPQFLFWAVLATSSVAAKQFSQAKEMVRRGLLACAQYTNLFPKDPRLAIAKRDLEITLGLAYAGAGLSQRLLDKAESVLLRHPGCQRALRGLVLVQLFRNPQALDRAAEHCQQLLASQPADRWALSHLAKVRMVQAELVRKHRRVLEHAHANQQELDQQRAREGQLLDQAEQLLQAAIESTKHQQIAASAQAGVGGLYLSLGTLWWHRGGKWQQDPAKAWACFLEAAKRLEGLPSAAGAFAFLGLHAGEFGGQKDQKRARQCFLKALQLDPTNREAGEALCRLLVGENAVDAALGVCARAVEKDPRCGWSWLRRARLLLYRSAGPTDTVALTQAVESYQNALREQPDNALTWEELGQVYLSQRKPVAALRALTRANELQMTHNRRFQLCQVQLELGMPEEAVADLEALLLSTDVEQSGSTIQESLAAPLAHKLLAETRLALAKEDIAKGALQAAAAHLYRARACLTSWTSLPAFPANLSTGLEQGQKGNPIAAAAADTVCYWQLKGDILTAFSVLPPAFCLSASQLGPEGPQEEEDAADVGSAEAQSALVSLLQEAANSYERADEKYTRLDNNRQSSYPAAAYKHTNPQLAQSKATVLSALSQCLSRAGRAGEGKEAMAGAQDAMKQAVALAPEDPTYWLGLGLVLVDGLEKQHCWSKAISLSPRSPLAAQAWTLLGVLYMQHARMGLAKKALENAQALDPAHSAFWTALGLFSLYPTVNNASPQQGATPVQRAQAYFARAAELDPGPDSLSGVLALRAWAHTSLLSKHLADLNFATAQLLHAQRGAGVALVSEANGLRAACWQAQGEHSRAIPLLQHALSLSLNRPEEKTSSPKKGKKKKSKSESGETEKQLMSPHEQDRVCALQRMLALAMSCSGRPAEAVGLWQQELKQVQGQENPLLLSSVLTELLTAVDRAAQANWQAEGDILAEQAVQAASRASVLGNQATGLKALMRAELARAYHNYLKHLETVAIGLNLAAAAKLLQAVQRTIEEVPEGILASQTSQSDDELVSLLVTACRVCLLLALRPNAPEKLEGPQQKKCQKDCQRAVTALAQLKSLLPATDWRVSQAECWLKEALGDEKGAMLLLQQAIVNLPPATFAAPSLTTVTPSCAEMELWRALSEQDTAFDHGKLVPVPDAALQVRAIEPQAGSALACASRLRWGVQQAMRQGAWERENGYRGWQFIKQPTKSTEEDVEETEGAKPKDAGKEEKGSSLQADLLDELVPLASSSSSSSTAPLSPSSAPSTSSSLPDDSKDNFNLLPDEKEKPSLDGQDQMPVLPGGLGLAKRLCHLMPQDPDNRGLLAAAVHADALQAAALCQTSVANAPSVKQVVSRLQLALSLQRDAQANNSSSSSSDCQRLVAICELTLLLVAFRRKLAQDNTQPIEYKREETEEEEEEGEGEGVLLEYVRTYLEGKLAKHASQVEVCKLHGKLLLLTQGVEIALREYWRSLKAITPGAMASEDLALLWAEYAQVLLMGKEGPTRVEAARLALSQALLHCPAATVPPAASSFGFCLQAHPDSLRCSLLLQQARLLYFMKKYKPGLQAVQDARDTTHAAQRSVAAYTLLGLYMRKSRKWPAAEEALRNALALSGKAGPLSALSIEQAKHMHGLIPLNLALVCVGRKEPAQAALTVLEQYTSGPVQQQQAFILYQLASLRLESLKEMKEASGKEGAKPLSAEQAAEVRARARQELAQAHSLQPNIALYGEALQQAQ